MKNKIIAYDHQLKTLARQLRNNSTLSEVLLWKEIKNRKLGVEFHRQVPILKYIVDFYCHELKLVIEIDGSSHQGTAIDNDILRQSLLERKGIKFIRILDADVKGNLPGVLIHIKEEIRKNKN